MFTFSPIEQKFEEVVEYVKTEERDGAPLRDDPVVRQRIAQLATQCEVARALGLRFVAASTTKGKPPTVEASEYKLYATQLSQRVANAAVDIAGPGAQLRVHTEDAPLRGRPEMTTATGDRHDRRRRLRDQKNIIARRKLGLPKNF
jgi:alkylation response protein AidB-like acyl-CoA dehydrogenase